MGRCQVSFRVVHVVEYPNSTSVAWLPWSQLCLWICVFLLVNPFFKEECLCDLSIMQAILIVGV